MREKSFSASCARFRVCWRVPRKSPFLTLSYEIHITLAEDITASIHSIKINAKILTKNPGNNEEKGLITKLMNYNR